MLSRLVTAVDRVARGLIYMAALVVGSAMAVTVTVTIVIGCVRAFVFLWRTILGSSWG